MSENNENYEEHYTTNHHHHYETFHEKHPWLSTLLTTLAVLLGAYLAFYTVTDWHFKRMLDPIHQMKRMEKMMIKEDRAMNKFMQKSFNEERRFSNYINLEEFDDGYTVTVNLKPFNNNEGNINVSTEKNTLNIVASSDEKNKDMRHSLTINQSYIFPDDVNFKGMTKKRIGDNLVIAIPKD